MSGAARVAVMMLIAGVLEGCGDDTAPPAGRDAATMSKVLQGVYAGRFPCADCPGIDTTLWLRPDGRFFIRLIYLDTETRSEPPAYNLGRWRWDPGETQLVLVGAGPRRVFTVPQHDRLQMQTDSPLDHVLMRQRGNPAFSDRLRLEGEYTLEKDIAVFTECLTRLRLTIASEGDYRRLRQHYRSVTPRGQPALAVVDGHLKRMGSDDATAELLIVDELITVKPQQSCPPPPPL